MSGPTNPERRAEIRKRAAHLVEYLADKDIPALLAEIEPLDKKLTYLTNILVSSVLYGSRDATGMLRELVPALVEIDALSADQAERVREGLDEQQAEVKQLTAELEVNRQCWYHLDQSRTECVAGFNPETRECAEGGGTVISQVEYQAQLIEIWKGLNEQAEAELREARADASVAAEALDAAESSAGQLRKQLEAEAAVQGLLRDEVEHLKQENSEWRATFGDSALVEARRVLATRERLAWRLANHASCDDHPEKSPGPDCPACADRTAYLAYIKAGGRDYRHVPSGPPISVFDIPDTQERNSR